MEKSNNRLKKCRFCNEVSRSQGQDPIGSLIPFDSWLIIELKQPWKYKIWIEPNPVPQEVIDLFQEIYHEKKLRTLAIAPDQEY